MRKLVRCKVCGYVMSEGRLAEKCPACGALRQVFEPYTDPVSETRRNVLDMDLHRISVHFPIASIVSVPLFLIGALLFPSRARIMLTTVRLVVLLLPLVVLGAFFAGMFDGITRFRKIAVSEILRRKVLYGVLFFALSIALNLLVWLRGFPDGRAMAIDIAVAVAAGVCAFKLGRLGRGIVDVAFPGK